MWKEPVDISKVLRDPLVVGVSGSILLRQDAHGVPPGSTLHLLWSVGVWNFGCRNASCIFLRPTVRGNRPEIVRLSHLEAILKAGLFYFVFRKTALAALASNGFHT